MGRDLVEGLDFSRRSAFLYTQLRKRICSIARNAPRTKLGQVMTVLLGLCDRKWGNFLIWNSDQGSQFTNPQYTTLLQAAGVQISMDGRGRALDNVFNERLWRTLKYEEVYLNDYSSPREARLRLGHYIAFYNHERVHQALDYRTPADVYYQKGMEAPLKPAASVS